MSDRRLFIKQSSAAALAAMLLGNKAFAGSRPQGITAGIQLFTFFGVIDKDVPGTLKLIADIGYKEIESAYGLKGGYYGMKPKEFSALVSSFGMSWQSQHVIGAPLKLPKGAKMPVGADGKLLPLPKLKTLKENMQELVDELAEGGVPYMGCATIPHTTLAEVKESITILNKTGEACKKAGITFCYHNHDGEFKNVEGKVPYDLFLAETDPGNVKMELDLCWATKAGVDVPALFKKHPGRFPLWHTKDLSADKTKPVPVGEGIVPFKEIFAAKEVAGMKHYFVEHDQPADPVASATTSFNNLKKIV